MIVYKTGNVFNTAHQTICCTINTIGAMGRGVALYTKKKYPEVYEAYRSLYKSGQLDIYKLFTVPTHDQKQILLFPTKIEWWNDTNPDWVARNLITLSNTYQTLGITSLAMVLPGAANGHMNKSDSLWLVDTLLNDLPIPVEVYC